MIALTNLLHDLRYVLRQLRRSPGFTLTAVLTLALGIGANTAVYSIVRSTLLLPLPYPQQQQLVGLDLEPGGLPYDEQTGSSADFLQQNARSFSSFGISDDGPSGQNFSVDGGHPQAIQGLRISAGYLPTLGVAPLLGRTFSKDEDTPKAAPTAILSEALWRGALGADPKVLGRIIHLNADSYTVIGVMPASFHTVDAPDLWQPLHLSPADPGYDGDNFQMIARLAPGKTVGDAAAEMAVLQPALFHAVPYFNQWQTRLHSHLQLRAFPLRDVYTSHVRSSITSLAAAVGAVLLMVCINLAGLLLARSAARHRELALRVALGAGRAVLLRLLLTENLLLAITGSVLGIALASALVPYLQRVSPIGLPQLHGTSLDGTAALVAILLGCLTVGLFGLVPALRSLHSAFTLASSAHVAGESASRQRLGKALLVSQIALTTILLSAGALILSTFLNMQHVHTGIEIPHLYAAQVTLRGSNFTKAASTQRFIDEVQRRLAGNPALESVAAVNGLPLDRGLNSSGYPSAHPDMKRNIEGRFVSPGYFRAAGTRLLQGNDLSLSDTATSTPVGLINQAAANAWFGKASALGQTFVFGGGAPRRVIGVVEDARGQGLAGDVRPTAYIPFTQMDDETASAINGWFPTTFLLRANSTVAPTELSLLHAATEAIQQTSPDVPLSGFYPMQHFIDKGVAPSRFFSTLATSFAGFAVLLTLIGTYGLLSFQVNTRTREFGVRMALGSARWQVLSLVLRRGLGLAALGLVVGLAAGILLRPALRSLLSQAINVEPASLASLLGSPMVPFIAAALTVLLAALAASLLPAARAATINPTEALRAE